MQTGTTEAKVFPTDVVTEESIRLRLLYSFFKGVVENEAGTIQDFEDCITGLQEHPYKISMLEAYFHQTGLKVGRIASESKKFIDGER